MNPYEPSSIAFENEIDARALANVFCPVCGNGVPRRPLFKTLHCSRCEQLLGLQTPQKVMSVILLFVVVVFLLGYYFLPFAGSQPWFGASVIGLQWLLTWVFRYAIGHIWPRNRWRFLTQDEVDEARQKHQAANPIGDQAVPLG